MFGADLPWSCLRVVRAVLVLAACAGSLSCNSSAGGVAVEGDEPAKIEGGSSALIEGRQVSYLKWTSSTFPPAPGDQGAPERARLSYEADTVLNSILAACIVHEARNMLKRDGVVWNLRSSTCPVVSPLTGSAIPEGWEPFLAPTYACAAEWAMTIANSTSNVYLGQATSGYWLNTEPLVPDGATDDNRSDDNASLLYVFPKGATTSDAASWALAAAELARVGAIMSTQILTCGSAMILSHPQDPNQRRSLAPYFATLASGTMSTAVEAAQKASELLHGAAKAQHATAADAQIGRVHAWRHAYDSLLRASSAYVQVPRTLYEPESYCEVFPEAAGCLNPPASCLPQSGTPPAACADAYPLLLATSLGAKDKRAEELLRDHRIDPRVSSTRSIKQVAYELLISINGRYRGAYSKDFPSGIESGLTFLKALGIREEELGQAANRIVQEARVLGRPVIAVSETVKVDNNKDGDTADASESLPVLRAYGTEKTLEPANPWYLYATTETAEWPMAPAGGVDEARVPTPAYAMRGVFHALDYFRSVYRRELSNSAYPEEVQDVFIGNGSVDGRTGHWWCTNHMANNGVPGVWECQGVSTGSSCNAVVANNATVTCHRSSEKNLTAAAMAYASSFVQGSVGIETCATCDGAAGSDPGKALDWVDVRIRLDDEPGNLTAEQRNTWHRARYDIWVGEEGLRCALSGTDPSGAPCDPKEYKFDDETGIVWSDTQTVIRLTQITGTANGHSMRENGPCEKGKATTTGCSEYKKPFGNDTNPIYPRLYVTAKGCADGTTQGACSRRVIAGFKALPPPVVAGYQNYYGFSIPVGSGIEDALMATLAADPSEPDDTMYECGDSGMRRNVKLGLESELSQSQGRLGENLVEESWSHYLSLAEQASKEADQIGDDLVQKGLEMDMRAEDARDELENLCGGVIDVNRIRTRACGSATASCDVYRYLESASDSDADLLPIKKCLGIEANANATLGPYRVCMWQFEGLAPCQCPKTGYCPSQPMTDSERVANPDARSACIAPIYSTLVGSAPSGAFTVEDCPKLFAPPSAGQTALPAGLTYQIYDNVLNLTPPIVPEDPVPEYSCKRLAQIRAGSASIPNNESNLGWSRADLADVAKRISVVRDDLNFARIDLDGGQWLKLAGGTNNAWGAASANTKPWSPCAPHTTVPAAGCKSQISGYRGLLCGLDCGDSFPTSDAQISTTIKLRQEAGERLAKAVETLRIITATGLEGIEVAISPEGDEGTPFFREAGPFSDSYDGGEEPVFAEKLQEGNQTGGPPAVYVWKGKSKFRSKVLCDYGAWIRHDPNGDRCKDEKDSSYLNAEHANHHGTWLHNVQERTWLGGTDVCIRAGGYPNLNLFSDRKLIDTLPPKCGGTQEWPRPQDGLLMRFVDAGGLVSWPQLTEHEVNVLWTTKVLDQLLRKNSLDSTNGFALMTNSSEKYVGRRASGKANSLERAYTPLANYTGKNLWDAFELACLATSPEYQPVDCEKLGNADDFQGAGDLKKMEGTLKCRGRQIARLLDSALLYQMPKVLIEALRDKHLANISSEFGGQYAQSVTRLYNAVIGLGSAYTSMQSELNLQGTIYGEASANLQAIKYQKDADVEAAVMSMELADNECSRANWQMATAALSATSSFLGGVASAYQSGGVGILSGSAGAAAALSGAATDRHFSCNAADIQSRHGEAIKNLLAKHAEAESTAVVQATSGRLLASHMNMEAASDAIKTNFADAQAALAELQTIRNSARRAAAKVLMLDSDDVGHQFAVNTAMRARMNTLRVRYETARKYAVRMTYLARRAIEQKVGMNLSDLQDDIGWVPAPSKWADTLCSLSGINYDEISDRNQQDNNITNGREDDNGYNYANQYVGDYVARLREFITAYENTYTSGTGRDTAVVSLRDDVLNVRDTQCEVSGQNELLQTGQSRNVASPGVSGNAAVARSWVGNCDTEAAGCVTVASREDKPFTCKKKVGSAWVDFDPSGSDDSNATDTSLDVAVQRTEIDCPGWGPYRNFVKAVSLQGKASSGGGNSGQKGNAPPSPPTNGLASWYVAADCVETSPGSGIVASCPSRAPTPAGENRTATAWPNAAGGSVKLLQAGIAAKPTLEFSNAYLSAAVHPVASSAYTVSLVYRAPKEANFTYFSRSAAASSGVNHVAGMVRALSGMYSPYTYFEWCRNASNGCYAGTPSQSGEAVRALFQGVQAPPGLPERATVLTVVASDRVNGTPGFLRTYVDGQLVYSGSYGPPAVQLGGVIVGSPVNTGTVQVAEHLVYSRALSGDDVAALHAYYEGAYGRDLGEPLVWLDGDDMHRLREGAQSPISGHLPLNTNADLNLTTSLIYDRGRGAAYGQYGQAAGQPTGLSFFSGGATSHNGLTFNGGSLVYLPAPAYLVVAQAGFSSNDTVYFNTPFSRDFTVSFVAKVDDVAAAHGLWGVDLHDTNEPTARVPSILVSGRKLHVVFAAPGNNVSSFQTPADHITAGVPFVLSLRSSAATNSVDLFVNGQLALNVPSTTATLGPRHLGRTGRSTGTPSAYLRGAVAQHMMHYRAIPDAEIGAMHRQLAASFGIDAPSGLPGLPVTPSSGAEYAQHTNLTYNAPYTLSWYDQNATSVFTPFVRDPYDKPIALSPVRNASDDRYLRAGWYRHWVTFESRNAGDYTVGWAVPTTETNLFAAPQLEAREVAAMSQGPTPFFPTDDDYYIPAGVCEDRNGKAFREKHWSYGCEYYCPPGLGVDCARIAQAPSGLPKRCYHQLKFAFNQERIEAGEMLTQAGFAAGNFNYRFEDVAVNIVGTGVKNCSKSETASTCYANNFLQYTLIHDGPFVVRNYFGEDYDAPLYPGKIQQAKALLAERYLSNPLSGADNGLLSKYWDAELVGRPLSGQYTLRVYDAPGQELNWSALEDVQLVINYRYWTRAN